MKILLLGADGQLGSRLSQSLAGSGQVVTSTRTGGDIPCDLANGSALKTMLDRVHADLIVNASAYTQVDRAEENPATAMHINGDVPGIVGNYAARVGTAVLHYSTDYVFDGQAAAPYLESDAAAPLGVYGESKLQGEQRLAASGCDFIILRTAWLYASNGRNFLTTMLGLAIQRDEISVVDDQIGTPTSAHFVAIATAEIIRRWMSMTPADRRDASGIYHLTAKGRTSWAGFASAIMHEATDSKRLSSAPRIRSIGTADYPTPARRPSWSVLNTGLVSERFGIVAPEWRDDLKREMRLGKRLDP